jgi:hypothetical protein
MHWGIEMARKGGVPAGRVLNAMRLASLTAHLAKRRRCAGGKKKGRRVPSRAELSR